jgi:hypothetical protein
MILYLKDLKKLLRHKHLQQSSRITNQFTKISSLYINNEQTWKDFRKTIPVTIASKIPRNKLNKGSERPSQ